MARVVIQANNVVNVHLPASELYSADKIGAIQRVVLGKLGHPLCCSGFLISFLAEEQEFTAN